MGCRVAVWIKPEAYDNPFVKLLGAPGIPTLFSRTIQGNFQASQTETVELTISNALQSLNVPVSGETVQDGSVIIDVLLKGDFGRNNQHVVVSINGDDIAVLFNSPTTNVECGGFFRFDRLVLNIATWNSYADGATDVTIKLTPSAQVDLASCPDGNIAQIFVKYMVEGTEGNPYDLRVEDPLTGEEHLAERLIAKGPHGERVPMQRRDGTRDYVMFWRALHTGRNLSRGPNTFSLECASPSGGQCCGIYRAIEQAVFFGRTDDNNTIDGNGDTIDPFPVQRYEGQCSFDIEGDGCTC